MEPNNFEKDFREKLIERTIEPSDKAWDRLDAMLNIVEKEKPKKRQTWLYVAASIAGFLLVGSLFFIQNKSKSIQPENSVVVKENIQKDSVVEPENTLLDAAKSTKKETVIYEESAIKKTKKESVKLPQKEIKITTNEKNQVAESSIIIKNNQSNPSINPNINIQNPNTETVENLLDTAEKNVLAENSAKPKAKSKVKVNASDLLDQADGELDLSFREKVIAKVSKNYETVKVAIANRNVKN